MKISNWYLSSHVSSAVSFLTAQSRTAASYGVITELFFIQSENQCQPPLGFAGGSSLPPAGSGYVPLGGACLFLALLPDFILLFAWLPRLAFSSQATSPPPPAPCLSVKHLALAEAFFQTLVTSPLAPLFFFPVGLSQRCPHSL